MSVHANEEARFRDAHLAACVSLCAMWRPGGPWERIVSFAALCVNTCCCVDILRRSQEFREDADGFLFGLAISRLPEVKETSVDERHRSSNLLRSEKKKLSRFAA